MQVAVVIIIVLLGYVAFTLKTQSTREEWRDRQSQLDRVVRERQAVGPAYGDAGISPTAHGYAPASAAWAKEQKLPQLRSLAEDTFGPPRQYSAKVLARFGDDQLLMHGDEGDFALTGLPRAGSVVRDEVIWFVGWNTGPDKFQMAGGGTRTLDHYLSDIPGAAGERAFAKSARPVGGAPVTEGVVTRAGGNTYIRRALPTSR
jgi:hypothetical protein